MVNQSINYNLELAVPSRYDRLLMPWESTLERTLMDEEIDGS